MNWFFVALIAPLLWAISNHLDKYIISKYFRSGGIGSVVIFGCIFGFLSLPIIFLFNPNVFSIDKLNGITLIVIGIVSTLGLISYYAALNEDEPSNVVPLYQLIPITTYIISFMILGETLNLRQILSGLLIISGALLLSLDLTNKLPRIKLKILLLMIFSCIIVSIEIATFKYIALQESFWASVFWGYVGSAVTGLLLFSGIKKYRVEIIRVIKSNSISVLSLNAFNEIINLIAYLIFMYAALRLNTTLVTLTNGFQPFFVFTFGVFLTLFFPRFGQESLLRKHLVQRVISILVIFIGTYFLNT